MSVFHIVIAQGQASVVAELAPVATVTAALVGAAVALYLNTRGRKNAERDRRRTLYSEAYRVGLEWCEGIHRVRRRPQDGSGDVDLVRHFHHMQERIAYYEGWLAMESPVLGRAYKRFLREVMDEARPLIQEAWSRPGRPPSQQTSPDDKGPALNYAKERFLLDVREHLSRWPWVRGGSRSANAGPRKPNARLEHGSDRISSNERSRAMRLGEAFDTFYDAISLGAKPTEKIKSASNGLREHLVGAYGLAEDSLFFKGSYPNGTAVAPEDRDNGEYDVDLVAVCAAADASANAALDDLEEKLAENATYRRLIRQEGSRKKPCVRLRYADDEIGGFHVDVVPTRASESDDPHAPLEVPRRDEGWHDTAPREYTEWCRERGERFARTVMMLKRWRDVHQSARQSVKSIVLQVLAAQGLGSHSSDGEALVEEHEKRARSVSR